MILNNGTIIFSFIAGAAIGSVVTWKVLKTRYEEEIVSVKEAYANRYPDDDSTDEPYVEDCDIELMVDDSKLDLKEMQKELRKLKYVNYSKREEVDIVDTNPYVISPEAFGDMDDYETVSLTYYSDGILADDADNIIEDVDDTVGKGSLETFGEYEDDSVFVRNERLKCDYEILLDTRKYSDVVGDEVDE